jgi:LysR family transcriptional regulator for metE and metH
MDLVELEIGHLKLVEAIADEGTMTRAAGRLRITQSALSHRLAGLETGFGVPLFRRVPRGMQLTPAGETLLATARPVLREVREAERRLTPSAPDEQGELRIATECYTAYHWLPSRLQAFQSAYPRVDVRIAVESTRRPVEALLAGRLDVAIVASPAAGPGLAARPLFEDELVVIVSPRNPLAARRFLRPADFAAEHLITYSIGEEDLTIFQEVLLPAGVRPARHSRVELSEAIVEMVKANLGIAVMARWAVARQLNAATLKALPLTKRGVHRTWKAVTLRAGRQPRYVGAFVDLLAAQGGLA